MIRTIQKVKQISPLLKSSTVQVQLSNQVKNSFAGIKHQEGYASMDGNYAGAYIAYACSENSFIYPITPSTAMGEYMDAWMSQKKKNIFGNNVQVDMMQSEAGVAGAMHGSATAGSLCSTFTSSQGLLLMVPNMFLMAGELLPAVFHVSSRNITKHGLTIQAEHTDVMQCRTTGWAMMFCSSAQEVMDLGLACHLSTVNARVPFMCIQDGFRTSHEISKVQPIKYEDIAKIWPHEAVKKNLRDYTASPHNPISRDCAMRPDIYFQSSMASQKYYQACPNVVEQQLKEVEKITGRPYKLFMYKGSENPDKVIVIMGSAAETAEETCEYLNKNNGYNVGVVAVKLFRPWSAKSFLSALPKSVKKIAVMDRVREEGAQGQPLYLDVQSSVTELEENIPVYGGIYSIGGRDFTPAMVKAVFDNLDAENPKHNFTVGINDDVTNTSLQVGEEFSTTPEGTIECIFWGLGSDGTVGANKAVIQNIIMNTDMKAQGYFDYDAFKTDGTTLSYVRFGPKLMKSHYDIKKADFVGCHKDMFLRKFDVISPIKENGTLLLNSNYDTVEKLESFLPSRVMKQIASKNLKVYVIDASKIARNIGLGKRTNSIMTAAFYKLSGVLPYEQAEKMQKDDIIRMYSKKGEKIVKQNINALEHAVSNIIEISYPKEKWVGMEDGLNEEPEIDTQNIDFLEKVYKKAMKWQGADIPVSAFEAGGYNRVHTTARDKRKIAAQVPTWIPDKCSQCCYCSIVCPHAVIRPFLYTKEEIENGPKTMPTRKAKGGSELAGFNFGIQISSDNCTGCEVCVKACPDKCLVMKPYAQTVYQNEYFDYSFHLKDKKNPLDNKTVKGSQFERPLFQFSGACAGCQETPVIKLLTQLFGKRAILANASGCAMVFGAWYPMNPYAISQDGRGPAFSHSLFEDNAEYGYGEVKAYNNLLKNLLIDIEQKLIPSIKEKEQYSELVTLMQKWIKNYKNKDICEDIFERTTQILKDIPEEEFQSNQYLELLRKKKDMITVRSFWIFGGDGWAYDIGYNGLDHVMNQKENFNLLVLDTEVYSNTGGQSSKATQKGATAKFSLGGKSTFKKDLGRLAMTYGHIYVASIAVGADYNQAVQAFSEAESYDGPSLIIAMCPCIDWNLKDSTQMASIQKIAVESGYWPLYRYDPRKKQPFQLDSKKIKRSVVDFLSQQVRFDKLVKNKPLVEELQNHLLKKNEQYRLMAMSDLEKLDYYKQKLGIKSGSDGKSALVLYGSETGNAYNVAQGLLNDLRTRGFPRSKLSSFDDVDIDSLANEKKIFAVISTAGQGEFPSNSKAFWKAFTESKIPADHLKNAEFAVFGLGDSSYVHFNQAAKNIDKMFEKLGGKRILPIGLGNDKDEDRYEKAWEDWAPSLYNEINLNAPSDKAPQPSFQFNVSQTVNDNFRFIPDGFKLYTLKQNKLLTREGYDRNVRHYEIDISNENLTYEVGDCLAIQPQNNEQEVVELLEQMKINPNQIVDISKIEGSSTQVKLPETISYKKLFKDVIDILGKPNRRFFQFLYTCAKDPSEKQELKQLISKEGKNDFKALQQETVTYKDLLLKYPSAISSPSLLAEHIPRIKPRLYSIASAQSKSKSSIELCIILNDWKTPSGKYRTGLNTSYLMKQNVGEQLIIKLHKGSLPMPPHNAPVVTIGVGTGIAPIRAMYQDREMAKKNGKEVGQAAFFFGARKESEEFLYKEEIQQWQQDGILTVFDPAWSRDQGKKVYVQDKILSNADIVFDILYNQKGYFYLCGSAGKIPAAAKAAISKIIQQKANISKEKADEFLAKVQMEGRWNLDVW